MPLLLSHKGLRHILDTCSRPTNNTFSLQQSYIRLFVFFCETYCFSSVPNIAPENQKRWQRNCLFYSKCDQTIPIYRQTAEMLMSAHMGLGGASRKKKFPMAIFFIFIHENLRLMSFEIFPLCFSQIPPLRSVMFP